MELHELLKKQITTNLTDDCWNNPHFKTFIQSVNDSYEAFERDKYLIENSFKESKKK